MTPAERKLLDQTALMVLHVARGGYTLQGQQEELAKALNAVREENKDGSEQPSKR